MRRHVLLLAVLASISACSTPEDTERTTNPTEPTTSVTASTSATGMPPTTTTSTTAPTTTTSPLAGNWASEPLVAYGGWGGIALGWWDGSAWITVDQDTELPVVGGEDYQVALLGSEAIVHGGPPEQEGCAVVLPEGLPGVPFEDSDALEAFVDNGQGGELLISGVAVSAPWTIRPRPVSDGEAHPDLEELAIDLLADRGFVTGAVSLVQVLDADLDGDGTIETFVVAEDTVLGNEMSGVYSIVFAVGPGLSTTTVVDESVIPVDDTGYPASFRVSAVADLSGDGKMEIVLSGGAWESSWVTVYELDEGGFAERMGAGCGV